MTLCLNWNFHVITTLKIILKCFEVTKETPLPQLFVYKCNLNVDKPLKLLLFFLLLLLIFVILHIYVQLFHVNSLNIRLERKQDFKIFKKQLNIIAYIL